MNAFKDIALGAKQYLCDLLGAGIGNVSVMCWLVEGKQKKGEDKENVGKVGQKQLLAVILQTAL